MTKPAQRKQTSSILKVNLLHPQGEQLKISGKFFQWLFGYGRFIIIVVEVIVILCFLVRFKLDADLQTLNNKIKDQAAVIQSHTTEEALIKQTQQKLQLIKQTYDTSPDWQNLFNKITAKTPTGVIFNNLTLDHSQSSKSVQFKITAKAKSGSDIAAFTNALREIDKKEADRTFKEVNISNLGFDQGGLNFTIIGSTK